MTDHSTWNIRLQINDFDTTITDWLITLACAYFVYSLRQPKIRAAFRHRATWRAAMICMYISLGVSSLFGGIAHGFYTTDANEWTGSAGQVIAWKLSMITLNLASLGRSCLALELIGEFFPELFDWGHNPLLHYLSGKSKQLWLRELLMMGTRQLKANVLTLFLLQLLISIALIVFYNDSFIISALGSLLSGLFIGAVVLAINGCRRINRVTFTMLTGLGLQFAAIIVQMKQIALHPIYIQHNATFHLIQLAGVFVFYKGMVTYVVTIATIEARQSRLMNAKDDVKATAEFTTLAKAASSLGSSSTRRRANSFRRANKPNPILFENVAPPLDNDCATPTTPLFVRSYPNKKKKK